MILLATCTALAGRSGGSSSSSISAASIAPGSSVTGAPAAPKPQKVATPPMDVSAMDLWRAYDANEVAADNIFKDHPLLVSGTVSSIDKDFTDDVIVQLGSPNQFMDTRAYLEDSEKAKAGSLRKGTKVVLRCTGGGKIVGSPVLRDCTIQ